MIRKETDMKTGKIEFILSNVGSKSEKMQPFLREADGNLVEVFKESDNPFKNDSLKPYEGKTVSITGEANEYGVFIIDTIDVIEEETEAVKAQDATVSNSQTPSEAPEAPEAMAVTNMAAKEIITENPEETEEKAEEPTTKVIDSTPEKPLKGIKKIFAFFHRK